MKIAILVCYNPTLINFRLDMMLKMICLGHQVVAIGNESDSKWSGKLRPYGIEYRFVKMQRNGLNPVWDFFSFVQLVKLLKKEKPDEVSSVISGPCLLKKTRIFCQERFLPEGTPPDGGSDSLHCR